MTGDITKTLAGMAREIPMVDPPLQAELDVKPGHPQPEHVPPAETCRASVTVASGITQRCDLPAGHDGEHRIEYWEYAVVWSGE